jgi:hypothetical protein
VVGFGLLIEIEKLEVKKEGQLPDKLQFEPSSILE